ncbi:hypothetical protein B9Z65_8047 [Elsinoe australis]|uniref:AB hydrolase-1 domain-containing protein n=1 Tax=Elsinoe australis TaxID=40998 RepID=A0A2P7YVX4_9PEZI|nr:hypothetical protein B9Z65_8047 [Elsinoe australis]
MAASKPTLVLVHGSWHRPEHFEPTSRLLHEAGYKIETVHLPTVHATVDKTSKTMDDDVEAVRKLVDSILSRGENVVVVAHSYGCHVGMSALSSFDPKSRSSNGYQTAVQAVVAIAGVALAPGLTQLEQLGGRLPPYKKLVDGLTYPQHETGLHKLFYGDLSEEDAKPYIDMLSWQSYAAMLKPLPDLSTPCKDIPVSYLMTKQDVILPYDVQKVCLSNIRAGGVIVHVEEADSSHSPFLSQPEATANFIRNRAGETAIQSDFKVVQTS